MITKDLSFSDYIFKLFPNEFQNATMSVGKNFFRNITIQVTEDCNLRCTYCYQHDKTPKKLKVDDGKKFIDLILSSDEKSNKYIKSIECPGVVLDFIGGEPFLEIETIDILTDYFIQRMIELNHPWRNRFKISIGSNGLLYFDKRVQQYIKKNAAHLSLTITIDGNKNLHDQCRKDLNGQGSYDRAIAAVKDYEKNYGYKAGTKITLSPYNLCYLKDALINFIKEGNQQININCVYEQGWQLSDATNLYFQLKEVADYLLQNNLQDDFYISILDDTIGIPYTASNTWCGGSGLMIALDVNGDIYPCIRYTPSSVGYNNKKFIIGNVSNGFIYNEEQEQRLKCLSCITRQSQDKTTEHCFNCPIETGCGDCAAYSYECYGEVGHRTTFHCDMHKARCLAQTYYKNKAYQKTKIKHQLALNCPKEWAIPIIGLEEYDMLTKLTAQV